MNVDSQLPYVASLTSASLHPYEPSVASSAASSCSSIFSVDAPLSQTSGSSSGSSQFFQDFEQPEDVDSKLAAYRRAEMGCTKRSSVATTNEVHLLHQRKHHPRRSSAGACYRPPPLVRQCERKVNFVDSLIDSATQVVEVIWPLSVPSCREGPSGKSGLTLRTFIQETLRRSRSSYSTLQVALYYLVLIKAKVPDHDFTMEQPEDTASIRALQCGRRMFLAALILASKYLQDRNYSARAWSKISGLKICEINTIEMAFLEAVNWRLHTVDAVFERWREIIIHYTPSQRPPRSPPSPDSILACDWKSIIPLLTPELDRIPLPPKTPSANAVPDTFALNSPGFAPLQPPSRNSTPTPQSLPRFLEPSLPPTPAVPRIGCLPTPQMTPQSAVSSTPAVRALAAGTGRSAMCMAIAQAQNATAARTTLDPWNFTFRPAASDAASCHQLSRRSSLGRTAPSIASSPESMVSDSSSRSSRASSISSASSAAWAPSCNKLARLATCRNVKLPYGTNPFCPKEATVIEDRCETVKDLIASPGFGDLALSDHGFSPRSSVPTSRSNSATASDGQRSSPERKGCRTRKRGRSSVDHGLQKNVRDLLQTSPSLAPLRKITSCPTDKPVRPDFYTAKTFVLHSTEHTRSPESYGAETAWQSPALSEARLAVQKGLGRKRACCAGEAALESRRPGPGMWKGIL